jgi:predicted GH43/DUF377 family glycosyl hydrolase
MHEGRVHILYRAEGFEKRVPYTKDWPVTSLGLAVSEDGYTIESRSNEPVIGPEPNGQFGEHGIQDPRIAKIKDTYYIMSAGVSRWGDRLFLHTTKDFNTYENLGCIQPEHEMRTAGLFPEKFGDDFCCLLRYQPGMWISYTPDFKEWHGTKLVLPVKPHSWYGRKLGIGATPIRQDDAWLLFWHGKDDSLDGIYSLGIMWLGLKDPSKIIKMQEEPILTVEQDYEREGYWPNVVYTCGAVEKNGMYLVYYGCADRCLALATVPVKDCRL